MEGVIIGCFAVGIVLAIPGCICFIVCVWAIYKSATYKTKNNTTVICPVPSTVQISNQASAVQNNQMTGTSTAIPFEQKQAMPCNSHPTAVQPVYDTVQDPSSSNNIFSVTTNQAYGCRSNHLSKPDVNDTYEGLEEYEEMSQPTIPCIVTQDNNNSLYY